jgi:hypothetical protein
MTVMTTTAVSTNTEEQMVNLVRNALVAAGHEMGKEGDHWPVIKSTVNKVLKDWENIKAEREINAEFKKEFGDIIKDMENNLQKCPADFRPEAEKLVAWVRELYDARFSPVDLTMYVVCDDDIPIHIRRAENMMRTLEDVDG